MLNESSYFPPLLGPGVQVVATACPLGDEAKGALAATGFKLPDALSRAVANRQEEFMAGRYCALQALAQSGATRPLEIGIQADRSPAWPAGYVGSIAHSKGRAAAAVASTGKRASVGIDFEAFMTVKQASELRSRILMPGDERLVLGLHGWIESERVTLVFSAKEAIYKCLRPLCGDFFGFEDAELTSVAMGSELGGHFSFVLKKTIGKAFESGWGGQGRFAKHDGWIYSAMELKPDEVPGA